MAPAALIDLDHLENYVSGDADLRDEIFGIFIEQLETLLDRLDAQMDDEMWYNTAHNLKGASRGVGAWTLGELSEAAEGYVGGGSQVEAQRRQFVAEVKALIGQIILEINELRKAA